MFPSRPLVWYGNNPRYRTYISIMRSISSDDLLEGLLGHGLFSDVLPPIFTSEAFYDYYKKKPRPQTSKKRWEYVFFENARHNGGFRPFGIPNPFAYGSLCDCLVDNWLEILNHFETYTANRYYKVSRIHLRKRFGTKSLFDMGYHNWQVDETPETTLEIGARFIVSADISNFFS